MENMSYSIRFFDLSFFVFKKARPERLGWAGAKGCLSEAGLGLGLHAGSHGTKIVILSSERISVCGVPKGYFL